MAHEFEITLMGEMRIRHGTEPVEPPANRKARGLLAYLVRKPGQHAREALADLLWPAVPAERGRRSLRVALSAVREALPDRVRADRRFVAFEPQPADTVDVEQLLQLGQIADLPAAEKLTRARERWRGVFLQGLEGIESEPFLEWLLLEREHIRQETLTLLHRLVDQLGQEGDADAARTALRMVLRLNPYEERAHRRLMENLARSGDLTRALAQFAACRELLTRELEVEPMPATTRLAERIERLRERPRHNLPAAPYPLTGRNAELQALGAKLRGEARLVTVFGPPGVGKTRLAIEAARECSDQFLDGAAWVPLAPVEDPTRLAAVITHTLADLGAIRPLRGTAEPRGHLLSGLRDQELLLLLDNYEHLLPEVDLLIEILQQSNELTLLVTSRARLNVAWEEVFELDGLALPTEAAAPDWDQSGAVKLFLQVARKAHPDLRPQQLPRDETTQILELTAGLPLAIELAASELRLRDLSEALSTLRSDVGALSSKRRDLPARQRSLRAAFDSALDLLSEEDQIIFNKLSAFRGGFDAAAAKNVAQAGRQELGRLVDAALIQGSQQPGETRFDLHALLKSYAEGRLREDPQKAKAVWLSHSEHYAAIAEREGGEMLMGARQKEAREHMLREWDNVLRGWEIAQEEQQVHTLHRYIVALWLVYEQMGWYREGQAFFTSADQEISRWGLDDVAVRGLAGRIRLRLGWFRFRIGDLDGAAEVIAAGEQLLDEWDARGDEIGFGRATRGLTKILTGDYDAAEKILRSTIELARDRGSVFAQAAARTYQSMNNIGRGDLGRAEEAIGSALELSDSLGDRRMVALAEVHQGMLALLRDDPDEARPALAAALGRSREFGDPWIEVLALHGLGNFDLLVRDWHAAERHFREGQSISEEIGEVRGICMCLNGLGWALLAADDLGEACRSFRRVLLESVPAGLLPEALAALAGVTLANHARVDGLSRQRRLSMILDDPALAELDRRWIRRTAEPLDYPPLADSSERDMSPILRRWGTELGLG